MHIGKCNIEFISVMKSQYFSLKKKKKKKLNLHFILLHFYYILLC
jgi:hypothetical protein